MSNQLQTNLETILNEKTTKILPENIKKDVQIFDVVGTLESDSGSSNVKIYSSSTIMNSDSPNEGTYGLIIKNSEFYGAYVFSNNTWSKLDEIPENLLKYVSIPANTNFIKDSEGNILTGIKPYCYHTVSR